MATRGPERVVRLQMTATVNVGQTKTDTIIDFPVLVQPRNVDHEEPAP